MFFFFLDILMIEESVVTLYFVLPYVNFRRLLPRFSKLENEEFFSNLEIFYLDKMYIKYQQNLLKMCIFLVFLHL